MRSSGARTHGHYGSCWRSGLRFLCGIDLFLQLVDAFEQRLHLCFAHDSGGRLIDCGSGLHRAVAGNGLLHCGGRDLAIAQGADEQNFVEVAECGRGEGAAAGGSGAGVGVAGIGSGNDATNEFVELGGRHINHTRSGGSGGIARSVGRVVYVNRGLLNIAAGALGFYASALGGNEADLGRVEAGGGVFELGIELREAFVVSATLLAQFFLAECTFGCHARIGVLAISFYARATAESEVEANAGTVHPIDVDLRGIGDGAELRIVFVEEHGFGAAEEAHITVEGNFQTCTAECKPAVFGGAGVAVAIKIGVFGVDVARTEREVGGHATTYVETRDQVGTVDRKIVARVERELVGVLGVAVVEAAHPDQRRKVYAGRETEHPSVAIEGIVAEIEVGGTGFNGETQTAEAVVERATVGLRHFVL